MPIRTGASTGLEQDHDGLAGPGLTLFDGSHRCLGGSRKDYGGVVRAGEKGGAEGGLGPGVVDKQVGNSSTF